MKKFFSSLIIKYKKSSKKQISTFFPCIHCEKDLIWPTKYVILPYSQILYYDEYEPHLHLDQVYHQLACHASVCCHLITVCGQHDSHVVTYTHTK